MKRLPLQSIIVIVTLPLALLACSVLSPAGAQPIPAGQVETAVAQTVEAAATQMSFSTLVAKLTGLAQVSPTATVIPATATRRPSSTPFATETVFRVNSVTPLVTVAQPNATPSAPVLALTQVASCYAAQFVSDVTVPDGTIFTPGSSFLKTWRLKNVGTCTWTSDFQLAFISGTSMDAPNNITLGKDVLPNGTIDLSVSLKAPAAPAEYTGNFQLRTPSGVIFGLGKNANKPFYVKIRVQSADSGLNSGDSIKFVNLYCSAVWANPSGTIGCPGLPNDFTNGSITRTDNPKMEGGNVDDEPALIFIPANGSGGYVSGEFRNVKIQSGDRLKGVIGCLDESPDCSVTFRISYRSGGSEVELGSWNETSDTKWTRIDADFSAAAAKTVDIIFTAFNNNDNSKDDRLFFLAPTINR